MTCKFFETRHSKTFIYQLAYVVLIAFSTILGAVAVVYDSRGVADYLKLLFECPPSLIVQLIIAFIPLCITYVVVLWRWHLVLYFLIAIKTVLFSVSAYAVFVAFPSAGWLIQYLMLFPCTAGICVFHWLWLRIFVCHCKPSKNTYFYCALTLLLTVVLDHYFVHPFTALLFIHK